MNIANCTAYRLHVERLPLFDILHDTQVRPAGIPVFPNWSHETDFSFKIKVNKFLNFRNVGQVHPEQQEMRKQQ